jgi:selenocysteine-specific elongation factor
VTGTLAAGTIRVNDTFVLAPSGREVHVRALQSLGQATDMVRATARVAVNLRGIDKRDVQRGDALLTPNMWTSTRVVDVRLNDVRFNDAAREPSGDLMLHVGSAAVPARPRALGSGIVRLTFATALPLRAGDIVLLRDPGRHEIVAGAQILDAAPPGFTRRGDAAARARELAARTAPLDTSAELRRRGIARGADLRAAGHTGLPRPFTGDWLVDTSRATALRAQLQAMVSEHAQRFPLEPGPTIEAVRRALDLPDRSLVAALVATAADSSLEVRDGRLIDASRQASLPPAVTSAIAEITRRLAAEPFASPDAAELRALGLGVRELAAAERAGLLIRVADGVVLQPDALSIAVRRLASLPQPFSVSQARLAWRTTRRVAVPLLELLDRRRVTTRLPDGTRTIANSSVESRAEGEGPR